MSGKIKTMINLIINDRAHGNPTLVMTTRTKLILKGFNPDKYGDDTPDDPKAMEKLMTIAKEMGVSFRQF